MAFRKFPPRAFQYVFPFVISIMMSCLVSGISTFRGVGPHDDFLKLWMSAWGLSWIIAFPTLLLLIPVARRIAYIFVEK